MTEKTEFLQAIDDAILDADSLERFINGDDTQDVLTRLSKRYPTLQKALKELFENGGLPATPFATKAEMESSALVDGDYAQVTDDTTNNGLYVKTAGTWAKSAYDPLSQSKIYADNLVDETFVASKEFTVAKSREGVDFIKKSTNLFDHNAATIGKSISVTGEISDNSSTSISDFIAVEPSQQYTMSLYAQPSIYEPFTYTAYYDIDKQFMYRAETITGESNALTITIPEGAYYIRFTMTQGLPSQRNRMFNKGSTALPYEPYYVAISAPVVPDIENKESRVISPSYNLLDPSAAETGKVLSPNFVVTDNESFSLTGYIKVDESATYRLSRDPDATGIIGFSSVAYFTKAGGALSREDIAWSPDAAEVYITAPLGSGYMRLNINSSAYGGAGEHKRMISKGVNTLPFVSFTPKLDGVEIADNVIDKSLSRYIKQSDNLVNINDIESGYVISPDGTKTPNASFSITGFIPVFPNTSYTMSGGDIDKPYVPFVSAAYYDKNKVFISRHNTPIVGYTGSYTQITPANAHYVVLNFNRGGILDLERMFVEGSSAKPYQFPAAVLKNVVLDQTLLEQIAASLGGSVSPSGGARYMYDVPVDMVYNSNRTTWSTDYTNFPNIKASAVYAMYDSLLADFPEYVTKEFLGNDGVGNPISLYTFKPKDVASDNPRKLPKIFMTLGTHGYEHVSPLCTYLLLREMCESYDDNIALEALRFNMELMVIPVVNPSGFDAYTRKNHNNVDIARNADIASGWTLAEPTKNTYGGPTEFSELETQYVKSVIDTNPDIEAFYDFHNFGGIIRDPQPYIWVPASNPQTEAVGQLLISRMERKFKREFSWINDDWEAGYTENLPPVGMLKDYAKTKGIPFAATFEIDQKWHIKPDAVIYDDLHCKTMVETLGNFLLITLDSISKSK